MKSVTIRMPDDLLNWLRKRAARETMETGNQYSINSLVVDVLRREMEAEGQEDGTDVWAEIISETDKLDRALDNKEISLKEYAVGTKALNRRIKTAKAEMRAIQNEFKADQRKEG